MSKKQAVQDRKFKAGDIVRLLTGSRMMTVTGYDGDGDVTYAFETEECIMSGALPEVALEMVKAHVAPPAPKAHKKISRKLTEPSPESFAGKVRARVLSGEDPATIARALGRTETVIAMWIGRLTKSGFLKG